MVVESIRELSRATPFVPFEIHMASGERHRVPHPDFISVSPKGTFVIVYGRNERPHHLSALLIERVSPAGNGKRGRRAA